MISLAPHVQNSFSGVLNIISLRSNLLAITRAAAAIYNYRRLCAEMLSRDLGSQYKGQALGTIWVVAHPMLLIAVYIFVFAFVFGVRLGGTVEFPRDYIIFLLSGLVPSNSA